MSDDTPTQKSPAGSAPATEAEGAPEAGAGNLTGPTFTPTRGTGRFPSTGRRATDGVIREGRARPVDRMLNLLLMSAEREVKVGITISVGNVVVSGTLIGTLAYCRALADQFASSAGGTDMDGLFADSFHDLVDDAAGVARGDRRSPPDAESYGRAVEFLHMSDARYVAGTGLLPLGRNGTLFRCPVSDISGWSLGDLTSR